MLTLRLLFAVREDREREIETQLAGETERAVALLGAGSRAIGFMRVETDPFAAQYPGRSGFEAMLAVDLPEDGTSPDRLIEIAHGADTRLGELVQPDLSGALIARRRRILGCEAPIRFVYLMRHKAGQTTAAFQSYWGSGHAEFGRQTQGITGYDQLHVEPAASRTAAREAGFGVHRIDGVPELHMDSLEGFLSKSVGSSTGNAAIEDEKNFVDGHNSVGFVLREVARQPQEPA